MTRGFLPAILSFLLLSACGEVQKPNNDGEKIALNTPGGEKVTFEIPGAFTPYEAHLPSGRDSILIDMWLPDLAPYWEVRYQMLSRKEDSNKAENFEDLSNRNRVSVEVFVDEEWFLRKRKEETVLPKNIDRDFDVKYNNLYFLGGSVNSSSSRPGLRFSKRLNGQVQARTSSRFWYVPVDESKYPATYLKCTRINLGPSPKGSCTAYHEISAHVFFQMRFPASQIEAWPSLIEKVQAFLLVAMNSETSSK